MLLYVVRKETEWESEKVVAVGTTRGDGIRLANEFSNGEYHQIPMHDLSNQVYLMQHRIYTDTRIVVNEVRADELIELCSAF